MFWNSEDVLKCEDNVLGEDIIIDEDDIEAFKYLGIIEKGDISHNEMKGRMEK